MRTALPEKSTAAAIAGLAIACMALPMVGGSRLTTAGAVLAAVAVFLTFLPAVLYFFGPRQHSLPFLAGIGVFYGVFFALPPFTAGLVWPDATPMHLYAPEGVDFEPARPLMEFNASVMAAVLLGWGLFLGGFVLARRLARRVPVLALDGGDGGTGWLKLLGWLMLAFHFAGLTVPWVQSLPSLGQMTAPLGLVGFGVFWGLGLKRKLATWEWVAVLGIALPARLVLGVSTGQLAQIVLIVAFLGFMAAAEHRKMVLTLMLGTAMLVLAGYRPLLMLRDFTWGTPGQNLTIVERLRLLPAALERAMNPRQTDFLYQADRPLAAFHLAWALKRLNQTVALGVVMEATPERVPYWNGATLKPLATGMIPRALWPGKPEERAGNAFGHRYGFIPPAEVSMSVNMPWLTESFANFGWLGIIAVLSVAGAALGVLDRVCNAPGTGIPERAVGGAVLFPLMNQESNLSLTTGNLPLILLGLFCLFRLAALASGRLDRLRPSC